MINVRIFGQVGLNPPSLLGQRLLTNKATALRDTADFLREIADAMAHEATFHEITQDFEGE